MKDLKQILTKHAITSCGGWVGLRATANWIISGHDPQFKSCLGWKSLFKNCILIISLILKKNTFVFVALEIYVANQQKKNVLYMGIV